MNNPRLEKFEDRRTITVSFSKDVAIALTLAATGACDIRHRDTLDDAGLIDESNKLNDYGRALLTLFIASEGTLKPHEIKLHEGELT